MSMWRLLFFALTLFVALFSAFYFLGNHPGGQRSSVLSSAAWQRMASPGALSKSHAFLEHNCAACHTSVKGIEANNCIVCHANNESLLQRQPTAFHANVRSCQECHLEHRGTDQHPTDMDHLALSKIGFVQLKTDQSSDGVNELLGKNLLNWIDQQRRHHRAVSRRPRRLQHHGKEFGIAGRTHALFKNGRTAFVKSGRGFIIAADDAFAWWRCWA